KSWVCLNIGYKCSLSSYAQVSEHGFVTSPYLLVKDGKVTSELVHLDATQEEPLKIAYSNTTVDDNGNIVQDDVICRTQAGNFVTVPPAEVDAIDVSPEQIWSVATAMIPFL